MWIRDVDFPAAVIDAHREGRLVLFVGAGASKDSPSGLPLFGELAADVAAAAQVTVTDAELGRPDALVGDLVDRGVDVHSLVATQLRRDDSRPNALHHAIAQLAVAGPSPRIVTTNYDEHLTAALTELGVVHDEYLAPALPTTSPASCTRTDVCGRRRAVWLLPTQTSVAPTSGMHGPRGSSSECTPATRCCSLATATTTW